MGPYRLPTARRLTGIWLTKAYFRPSGYIFGMSTPAAEPAGHRDATFGLARSGERVLMVRNARVSRGALASWWDLPGGAVRRGENLAAALVREWAEETGLDVRVGGLRLVMDGVKRRADGPRLYTWRAFFFDVQCEGRPVAGAGIEAAEWVPEAEVAERLRAPYHEALRRHLAGDPAAYATVEWVEEAGEAATLSDDLRHLLILSAAAAVGDLDLLHGEIVAARAVDERRARILEALLQIVPYSGYPRAIAALGVGRALLDDATAIPDRDRRDAARIGRDVFDRVYGETAERVLSGLEHRDPVLAQWTIENAYGRVLCREGALSLLERELLAVSILTAMGGLEAPLLGHMRAVLRLGGTSEQVRAAVQVVPSSYGEARRASAQALLERL